MSATSDAFELFFREFFFARRGGQHQVDGVLGVFDDIDGDTVGSGDAAFGQNGGRIAQQALLQFSIVPRVGDQQFPFEIPAADFFFFFHSSESFAKKEVNSVRPIIFQSVAIASAWHPCLPGVGSTQTSSS